MLEWYAKVNQLDGKEFPEVNLSDDNVKVKHKNDMVYVGKYNFRKRGQ